MLTRRHTLIASRLLDRYNDGRKCNYLIERNLRRAGCSIDNFKKVCSAILSVVCLECRLLPVSSACSVVCLQCRLLPVLSASCVVCFECRVPPVSGVSSVVCFQSRVPAVSSASSESASRVVCCHCRLLSVSSAPLCRPLLVRISPARTRTYHLYQCCMVATTVCNNELSTATTLHL